MSPIEVEKRFYNGEAVAMRKKGEDCRWILCTRPVWNWGVMDYKIIDLEIDDYDY